MAIRPFQFQSSTFSRDTFLSLFRTYHHLHLPSSSSSSFPTLPSILLLRSFAASAPSSFSRRNRSHPPPPPPPPPDTLAQKIGKSTRRPSATSKARIYADINVVRPKEYWDYENLTVQWG
ncbi:hypothetical protein S245_015426, partial [Arachis hypogaea]